jgi:Uma2 family endonuclease
MATKTLLTLEQFERLPDDGLRHELDEGELITMPPTFGLHGKVLIVTSSLLFNFVRPRSLGLVVSDVGFQLSANTLRAPDIAFIKADRALTLDLERRFVGAPDLAIEIISPSETAADIAHKVRQYLHAGAIVWVLYPKDRSVHAFDSAKNVRILEGDDLLDAPALLPGFSVRVNELFA